MHEPSKSIVREIKDGAALNQTGDWYIVHKEGRAIRYTILGNSSGNNTIRFQDFILDESEDVFVLDEEGYTLVEICELGCTTLLRRDMQRNLIVGKYKAGNTSMDNRFVEALYIEVPDRWK